MNRLKSNTENAIPIAQLPVHERIIVSIDRYPWSSLYRIGLGYGIPLLYFHISSNESSEYVLILWFVFCLLVFRIVPAILRNLLPFSKNVRTIWAERREMAKRYDSYQWRKLMWFGIGMACFMMLGRASNGVLVMLTAFSLIGGALGLECWRKIYVSGNAIVDQLD